ncbi:unnamed protein product [Rotaria magnacalcarata]|uniref:Mitochondrial import inner membrane translocase subunit Tim21 n=1 Tax=Rotaria magnacalcarata TaxID=392030 RepID=A0A816QTT4_9BILA|nr:unnamed protein product [Rotaria magnacalcarata]CAF1600183.1 unnamed protein product [Rotaria magnacalcarata]CAF2004135.1 unnamed protein product [Rotaria magnacalcarata]CAF2064240.1 unnamed protein product [Rotaria magnacalcarata]CAF2154140.1 unnamed protein product [Rotaria magnacalcarata]
MISPSFHLVIKQCHKQWRSSLFRTIVVIHQRQLSTIEHEKQDSKKQDNDGLVQSQNSQIQKAKFTQKAQQTAKDTAYSLVVVAGVATLSGLCYVIMHELYSRETPNGIYREASRICLENSDVQEALGLPIIVHTTPQIGSMRINNVRARTFDEKGHQSMTVSFYLTGKERSGVVAIKVQKNISNKFVYDYILVQLDKQWHSQNIVQVYPDFSSSSFKREISS